LEDYIFRLYLGSQPLAGLLVATTSPLEKAGMGIGWRGWTVPHPLNVIEANQVPYHA